MTDEEVDKAYDHYAKHILSYKGVQAYLLKSLILEYEDIPIRSIPELIEKSYTEKSHDKLIGLDTLDESIRDSPVIFDVLFQAETPITHKKIFINVEAQNKDYPGYDLITRAHYYGYRLLDRQKNHPLGFDHSNYDDIKSVYTIWIYMEHPKYKDNVINRYITYEECLNKEWHGDKRSYQKVQVIMIYLGHEKENSGTYKEILDLLNLLFRFHMTMEEKKKRLREKYNIKLTDNIMKEMKRMFSYSQYIRNEGREEGHKEGRKTGIRESSLKIAKKLLKDQTFTIQKISDITDLTMDELQSLKNEITQC